MKWRTHRRYFGAFTDLASTLSPWRIEGAHGDRPTDAEIVYAAYDDDDLGRAIVVFRRDGKMFEVNGFTCSMEGLVGQWEPEETSIEALALRHPGELVQGDAAVAAWKHLFG